MSEELMVTSSIDGKSLHVCAMLKTPFIEVPLGLPW
jgi:hypothetical protein